MNGDCRIPCSRGRAHDSRAACWSIPWLRDLRKLGSARPKTLSYQRIHAQEMAFVVPIRIEIRRRTTRCVLRSHDEVKSATCRPLAAIGACYWTVGMTNTTTTKAARIRPTMTIGCIRSWSPAAYQCLLSLDDLEPNVRLANELRQHCDTTLLYLCLCRVGTSTPELNEAIESLKATPYHLLNEQ